MSPKDPAAPPLRPGGGNARATYGRPPFGDGGINLIRPAAEYLKAFAINAAHGWQATCAADHHSGVAVGQGCAISLRHL